MAPKRRTSGLATKSSQSTLAFHGASNKVTKPGAKAQGAKKGLSDTKIHATTPEAAEIEHDQPSTAEALFIEPARLGPAKSTPQEDAARRMTGPLIHQYWTAKEAQRKAPRAHQTGLSVQQKILREFDMSAQYGPCTGIARLKRWKRAEGLALDPPLEVLAVLLKEEGKQGDGQDRLSYQRSIVDELSNSKTELEW